MKKKYNSGTSSELPFDTQVESPIDVTDSVKNLTEREKRHKQRIAEKLNKSKQQPYQDIIEDTSHHKHKSKEPKIDEASLKYSRKFQEMKEINEEKINKHQFRSRRNKLIIIVLIILILLMILFIISYASILYLQNNCFIYVHGDGNAYCTVNDVRTSRFRAPTGVQDDRVFYFDLNLRIRRSGEYYITFYINIYLDGEQLTNTAIYDYNHELFYTDEDGDVTSRDRVGGKYTISGNTTIDLCQGVVIDTSEISDALEAANFRMEIHVYLDKA